MDFRWRVQGETSECGLACIAICLNIFNSKITLSQLRARTPAPSTGMSLRQVADAAAAHDLLTRAVKCELDDLYKLSLPAIIHWKFNHFVVLTKVNGSGAWEAVDPSKGKITLSRDDLDRSFTGVALEVFAAPSFTKAQPPPKSNMFSYISLRGGLAQALWQTVVLSLLVQIFAIASPFFLQLSIDEAALKSDASLLKVLAFGFLLLSIFNVASEFLRNLVVQRISSIASWQITTRLFHHMIRLPIWWFQRRRLADTLTRFDSIVPIRQLISDGIVSALLDGLLGITLVIVMLFYSWQLGMIVLLSSALSALVRFFSLPALLRLSQNLIQATVSEKGKRIETLRAIQTIKLMRGEAMRERDWANSFGQSVNEAERVARFQVLIGSVQSGIESIGFVVVVYFAATSLAGSQITVGMLYAFLAYRTQFISRFSALIEQIIQWRLISLHTWRLSDIAEENRESNIDGSHAGDSLSIQGVVEIRNVRFAYSRFERPVLNDASAVINQGECAVIFGPSGGGKSTLLKIVTGLYPSSSGGVFIDGISIQTLGPAVVREVVATVMQDDELLSGTIVENVTFFSENPDNIRVWQCLELASVANEVKVLPMQLNTLIGDMGSSLSGGQRQRIVLARALYRQPKILILDEATSNLDVNNESSIHDALRGMKITRIVVTHRPDTMRIADKLFSLSNGILMPLKLGASIVSE